MLLRVIGVVIGGKVFHFVVLGLWLVVPPLWFAIESMYFAKFWSAERKVRLKETQEIVTKIWAGVSALLALLASELSRG